VASSCEVADPRRSGFREREFMAVPKRRQSNAKTGSRRAHDALKPKQLSMCEQCSTPLPTHMVCPKCGHYMGRKVVETES